MPTQLFNEWGVAYAEAEKKPIGISFRERLLSGSRRHGIARVNVRDAGRDHDSPRRVQQQSGVCQCFASSGFAEPDRAVSEFLEFARRFLRFACRVIFKLSRPDSNRS